MQCERCNKKKATVFYRENMGGRIRALRLCGECAEMLEQAGELEDMGTAVSGFTSPFFLSDDGIFLFPLHTAAPASVRVVRKCTVCGTGWSEIAATGKVGCAACYSVFSEELSGAVRALHGRAEHTGRVSAGHRARIEAVERMKALRGRLKEAVSAEDYEAAAELRDEIRALEARVGKEAF